MPTYDYACKECGHQFEAFQSMKDDLLVTCPSCSKDALQRLIGAGAGLVFKGSGYYLTDYKKSSTPQAALSGGAASENGTAAASTNGKGAGSGKDTGTAASNPPTGDA